MMANRTITVTVTCGRCGKRHEHDPGHPDAIATEERRIVINQAKPLCPRCQKKNYDDEGGW
jgi:ribosomal protein L37E